MPTFRKALVQVGDFLLSSGRKVHFSLADLQELARNARSMLAKQITIPVVLEHGDEGPVTGRDAAADFTRNVVGFLKDCQVKDDTLVGLLDIPRDEDADQVELVGNVSVDVRPDVYAGNQQWPGQSIFNVACTATPVWNGQPGFEPVAALAMSRRGQPIRLSLSDIVDADGFTAADRDKLRQCGIPV